MAGSSPQPDKQEPKVPLQAQPVVEDRETFDIATISTIKRIPNTDIGFRPGMELLAAFMERMHQLQALEDRETFGRSAGRTSR